MRNRIFTMAITACFMTLLVAHNAMAVRPNAGDTIDNTVTVDYEDALGFAMDQVSDTVSITVLQVYSVDVTPSFDSMSSCTETEVLYAFTVTNTGNGSDEFAITSVHQASDWEDGSVTFYTDAGITPLAGNVVLGNSSSIDLWAGIDTPVWSAGIAGQQSIDRLTATSVNDGSATDYDEVTTTVLAADLSTSVKDTVPSGLVTPQQYVIGETVTYEITVTNSGNVDATSVSLSDSFNAIFGNFSTTNGTFAGQTLGYNLGSPLAPGGSFTVTVTTVVQAGAADGIYGNTASLSFASCGNTENVQKSVNIEVVSADLSNSLKFANATSFEAGETITYTIRLVNSSLTLDAANVEVFDTLPVEFENLSSNVGSFTGQDFYYSHGTLAANTFFDIIIEGTVVGGLKVRTQVDNTATIEYDSGTTHKGPEPTTTETVYIQVPVLTVDKSADTATAAPGDTITYTITVTNTGGADARSVVISDTLSGFVTFGSILGGADAPVNCSPSEAGGVISGNPTFGGYPAGVIPAGGTMSFKYTATVDTTP